MPSVVILKVVMLGEINISFFISIAILSNSMLVVDMLSIIMLNIVILSDNMLGIFILS